MTDTLRVIQPGDTVSPGDVVECIEARNAAWYLLTGGRYVVEHVQSGDGSRYHGQSILWFAGGPCIGWPGEQFRMIRRK